MSSSRPSFAKTYAAFTGLALAAVVILAGLGCLMVSRMARAAGFESVLVGCGISWLASCVGAIPVARTLVAGSGPAANAVLASTAIRFAVVLVTLVPLLFSGWFDRTVLVVAVVASYLLLLVLDTMFAVRTIKRLSKSQS